MNEKFNELVESNAEIRQSYRALVSLMKGFIFGCSIVMVLFIAFMIDTRSDIATIKATLATTENITTLRDEISALDKKYNGVLGGYLSLTAYIEIEAQRSIAVADVLFLFGQKVNVRDEELERFRNTAIFKLNNCVKLGTTRSFSELN